MTGEKINFDEAVEAATAGDKSNDRSTIAFPYLDLDTAVDVARAVYARAGRGACELDGLAAEMSQTVSGAFRLKTGTARIFGLLEKDGRDSLKLTALGQRIVSDDQRGGRVDAFLTVPLYSRIFDSYRGTLLPPAKALEREMQTLGVAPKQADKARQAFERSARQAGFFEAGEGRLVKPKLESPEKRPDAQRTDGEAITANTAQRELSKGGGGGGGATDFHPFIQGLLKTLPVASTTEAPSEWPMRERAKWLKTAASIFGLIYTDDGGGEIEISVKDDR